jgi:hypothetical protein
MQRINRIGVFLVLFISAISIQAMGQALQSNTAPADNLFRAGKFAEARKIYTGIAEQDPKNYSAAVRLGEIALLSNQFDDSQKWLERALALKPGDADAKIMLAEAFYRQDKFDKAAAALSGVGPEDADKMANYLTLNVPQLQSFKGQTPYELQGAGESTSLKFVTTQLLPVVQVRINGGPEKTFFIDTGNSVLLLDTEFARELGIKSFGSVQGTFSGGLHAAVQIGRSDSLTLGDWTLKNVPVAMLPLRSFSKSFGVNEIDGCIGTNVLYQFLSTIDYPAGELVLRRGTISNLKKFDAAASAKNVVVPFWLAGDHFIVARGRVETLPPTLLFVDSGLAGAGVKLAGSVIKQAGITLQEDKASEGAGGGGKLKIVPYTVSALTFGDITEKNVPGLYDGPFPFENAWGFHVSGMVGNDFLKSYAVTFDFIGMRIILR